MADDGDPPYFLDFLFNDIIDVHWGGGYLVIKTYGQEFGPPMASWHDLFFFNGDNFPDLQVVYKDDTELLSMLPAGGSVRIVQNAFIANQEIAEADLKGTLRIGAGGKRKLRNSFALGAQKNNSSATMLFFIALTNFGSGTLKIEVNTGAEQPNPYGVQLFSYKSGIIAAGEEVSSFLPGKATGQSSIVDGSTNDTFLLDLKTLKFTEA